MEDMATANELLIMKTKEAEQRKILALAKESETLESLIQRIEAMLEDSK